MGLWRAVLAVTALGIVCGDRVIPLTPETFDSVVHERDFAVVQFFSPTCPHSQALAPEYSKAAAELWDDDVVLATVDVAAHPKLAARFGVYSYPTLAIFKHGVRKPYTGGRTAEDLVRHIRKVIAPPCRELADAAAVTEFAQAHEIVVVGFFASTEEPDYAVYHEAANHHDVGHYGHTTSLEAAAANNVTFPAIVLLKKFDEGRNVMRYKGALSLMKLVMFIQKHSQPNIIPWLADDIKRILKSNHGKAAILITDRRDDVRALEPIALEFKHEMVFSHAATTETRLIRHLALADSDLPAFVLLDTSKHQRKRYHMDAALTPKAIEVHIHEFLEGNLTPHFRSQPAPPAALPGEVVKVVGTTFDALVMRSGRDVMFMMHSGRCTVCDEVAGIFRELARRYKDNGGIAFATMDGTHNEVEGLHPHGYPMLKWFPKGGTDREGDDYRGGRAIDDFVVFITRQRRRHNRDEL